jgi:probable selenium-dependent hydroxylase accessory protein YqeC
MSELIDLLGARRGIVCAVGAGGKKSALFAIAARHPGRLAFTTTVHSLPPPESLGARTVIAPENELATELEKHADARFICYASPGDKPGRLAGVSPACIAGLHDSSAFDVTLVKADGARMRWVKAPADDEPVVVPGMATLLVVLSARALGEPLTDRIAHRVERLAAITGARAGDRFEPRHAAQLLASKEGLLKGAGNARVVAIINMVDDPERRRLATETAEQALVLAARLDRVVLARLREPNPVVAVIERGRLPGSGAAPAGTVAAQAAHSAAAHSSRDPHRALPRRAPR